MPVLSNPQWEQFATLVSSGTPTQRAYELAGYKPAKGNPFHLAARPEVKARIEELEVRAAGRDAKGQTVERLIGELDEMYEKAGSLGQPSAGVAAVMAKAKLLGLIVDKQEVDATVRKPMRDPGEHKPMTLAEWEAKFKPKTGVGP